LDPKIVISFRQKTSFGVQRVYGSLALFLDLKILHVDLKIWCVDPYNPSKKSFIVMSSGQRQEYKGVWIFSPIFGSKDIVYGSTDIVGGSTDIVFGSTDVVFGSTDIVFGSTDIVGRSTDIVFGSTNMVCGSTDVVCGSIYPTKKIP